jgi:hypothetical protein
MMNYSFWVRHFRANKTHRMEPPWAAPVTVDARCVPALLRSLQQFHLGDGGGECRLIAHDVDKLIGGSAEVRELVDLWFAEEAEHSRLLGRLVERFGGRPIITHWSFRAFCLCRRWGGVRFELRVLLLTEIVSTAYYRLMRRFVPDPAVRAVCRLILRDEAGHVAFHRDRIATSRRLAGAGMGLTWFLPLAALGFLAGTVLWVNHRACLRNFGASDFDFYREVWLELARFRRRLVRGISASVETSGSATARPLTLQPQPRFAP